MSHVDQQNQAVAKTKGCSQSPDKAPLLKITPTQLTEHGEVELVPTWSLHPYVLTSLVQEGTQLLPKEKHKHQPHHKTLT